MIADRSQLSAITTRLVFDKRDDGAQGRRLIRPIVINGVHLETNDRLEPSAKFPDVGVLEGNQLPIIITFWRSENETITRHRNPLFDPEIGITPRRVIAIDELHTFQLGVVPKYNVRVFWAVLLSDCFDTMYSNQEEL